MPVRRKRASMADVAKLAGVSPQTVSRVSNGEPYVVDDKRQRVFEAMKELGYRPNSAARAMKRGSFDTLGVVYYSLHDVGNYRSLEAISEAAAERGYATTLIPLQASTRRATDGAFTKLGEMTVDAAIAIIPSQFQDDAALHLPQGIPLVVLGPRLWDEASAVDFEQTSGVSDAMHHLIDLGHRRIDHISGPTDSYSAQARRRIYEAVLSESKLPAGRIWRGDWSPQSGYQACSALLDAVCEKRTDMPTAIFVANDQMALGAFRAPLERGLRVPEDVSLIGFDNIDEAVEFPTPLTTVIQDWDKVGANAVDLAIEMLNGGAPTLRSVPTRLIVRQSTAEPGGQGRPRQ